MTPILSAEAVAAFNRDGFLAIDSVTPAEDIARVRSLLDPLFDRFNTLGDCAVDLAGSRERGVAPRSPEINEVVKLAPALRETLVYARCRDIARQLLGVPVGYQFDHSIYKPPHNKTPTAWHQDEAYSDAAIPLWSIHFWIPLQEATVENGCMWFIPNSHQGGLLPHHIVHRRAKGGTIAADDIDSANAVACPVPVGGVTVHQPLTLHYTGANESDGHRRVWILHFGAFGRMRFLLHPKSVLATVRSWVGRPNVR